MLLMLAQPAGIALGLLGIATWCLLRGRYPVLAVLAFALSLTLKPHLGALVWIFFLLAKPSAHADSPALLYRRRALQILAATVLLSAPGLVWASISPASRHWPTELGQNLRGIARHGAASDPGPANDEAHDITSLQAAISVLRDQSAVYTPASYAIAAVLFLAWLPPVLRRPNGPARDLFALAAIASLSLLPIYHRQYDTRLLLLTFPAASLLLATRLRLGALALLLTASGIVLTSHNFPHLIARLLPDSEATAGPLVTLLAYRPMPLFLLALTVFYLICLYRPSQSHPV